MVSFKQVIMMSQYLSIYFGRQSLSITKKTWKRSCLKCRTSEEWHIVLIGAVILFFPHILWRELGGYGLRRGRMKPTFACPGICLVIHFSGFPIAHTARYLGIRVARNAQKCSQSRVRSSTNSCWRYWGSNFISKNVRRAWAVVFYIGNGRH